MKKVIITVAIALTVLSCNKEEKLPEPIAEQVINPDCLCGVQMDIGDIPDPFGRPHLGSYWIDMKNDCSGNIVRIDYIEIVDFKGSLSPGLPSCLSYAW